MRALSGWQVLREALLLSHLLPSTFKVKAQREGTLYRSMEGRHQVQVSHFSVPNIELTCRWALLLLRHLPEVHSVKCKCLGFRTLSRTN